MRLTKEQIRTIILEELHEVKNNLQKYIFYFDHKCKEEHAECGDSEGCLEQFMDCQDRTNIIKKATKALESGMKIEDSPDELKSRAKKKYLDRKKNIEDEKRRQRQIKYQQSKTQEKEFTNMQIIEIILILKERYTDMVSLKSSASKGSVQREEEMYQLAKMDEYDIGYKLESRYTEKALSGLYDTLRDGAYSGYWSSFLGGRGYYYYYDSSHERPPGYDEVDRFLNAARKEGYLTDEDGKGSFKDKIPAGLYEEDESTGITYFVIDDGNRVEIPLWYYSSPYILDKY